MCATKLVEYSVPSVCIGLTRAHLVVAMLSLNVGGIYDSLIFETGIYGPNIKIKKTTNLSRLESILYLVCLSVHGYPWVSLSNPEVRVRVES
jgi:hypothetical protein